MSGVRDAVREKIVSLADELGHDASGLGDDEIIPDRGWLDSATTLEFLVWLEDQFGVMIEDSEVTTDNLGSVSAIEGFILGKRKARTDRE
jgi:acyl carrier protein